MPALRPYGLFIAGSEKDETMAFWSNLFGGATPEEKQARAAAKSEARARREADELAEKAARTDELFERALGNDRDNSSCDARRKAAIKLVLANETAKGREAWLSTTFRSFRAFP